MEREWKECDLNGIPEVIVCYGVELYADPFAYENGTKDEKYYSEVWLPVRKRG
ncbi:MAG: hypothetical protein ACI32N_01635 [Bulleidia sp.]